MAAPGPRRIAPGRQSWERIRLAAGAEHGFKINLEPGKTEADPDAATDTTLETKPRKGEEEAGKGLGKQAAGLAGLVGAVAMYWLSAAH